MALLTIGDQFPAYNLTAVIGGDLSKARAIEADPPAAPFAHRSALRRLATLSASRWEAKTTQTSCPLMRKAMHLAALSCSTIRVLRKPGRALCALWRIFRPIWMMP